MLGDHQRRRICGRCHREYGGRQSHRKGQKISKAIFGVLNSSKKTNVRLPMSSQDNFFYCFIRFLEELRIPKFAFEVY